MNNYHKSVLLQETIDLLNIKSGKRYIDGTLGGGGHTCAILEKGGKVLGLDVDRDAIEYVDKQLRVESGELRIGKSLILAKGNFKDIDRLAKENGFEKVSGVLFDLGVSSHHFDIPERGFSVQHAGPLDMRMDHELSVKAGDLVNALTRKELIQLFFTFGEERFANRIADAIVRARLVGQIQTTTELVGIINKVVPRQQGNVNPATRIFQALRIAVNDELNNIREALPKALELLEDKGRMAVISFHSLEDRIIKNQFKIWEDEGKGKIITAKPIAPSLEEVEVNNRSRSAKLRVFEKVL